jgi:hypothetical protein
MRFETASLEPSFSATGFENSVHAAQQHSKSKSLIQMMVKDNLCVEKLLEIIVLLLYPNRVTCFIFCKSYFQIFRHLINFANASVYENRSSHGAPFDALTSLPLKGHAASVQRADCQHLLCFSRSVGERQRAGRKTERECSEEKQIITITLRSA